MTRTYLARQYPMRDLPQRNTHKIRSFVSSVIGYQVLGKKRPVVKEDYAATNKTRTTANAATPNPIRTSLCIRSRACSWTFRVVSIIIPASRHSAQLSSAYHRTPLRASGMWGILVLHCWTVFTLVRWPGQRVIQDDQQKRHTPHRQVERDAGGPGKDIRAKGYTGGESTVRGHVAQRRREKRRPKVHIPLRFNPGGDGQVDRGEAIAIIAGERIQRETQEESCE